MSEELYSYLKSRATIYIERESPQLYPPEIIKGIRSHLMGYLEALLDFDIITTECYYEWCDYVDGRSGCPLD